MTCWSVRNDPTLGAYLLRGTTFVAWFFERADAERVAERMNAAERVRT